MPMLFYNAPSQWIFPLIMVCLVVIVHQFVRRKPVWQWLTGLVVSLSLGWLARTLGLGWFAVEYFGSTARATAAYVFVGAIWVWVEAVHDYVVNVWPRYAEFVELWAKENYHEGLPPITRTQVQKAVFPIIRDWNERNSGVWLDNYVILPGEYHKAKNRIKWVIAWWVLWPAFAFDVVIWALRSLNVLDVLKTVGTRWASISVNAVRIFLPGEHVIAERVKKAQPIDKIARTPPPDKGER